MLFMDKSQESKKEMSAAEASLTSSNVHVVTSRLPMCKTPLALALRAVELKAAALNSRASASKPNGNSSSNFTALEDAAEVTQRKEAPRAANCKQKTGCGFEWRTTGAALDDQKSVLEFDSWFD